MGKFSNSLQMPLFDFDSWTDFVEVKVEHVVSVSVGETYNDSGANTVIDLYQNDANYSNSFSLSSEEDEDEADLIDESDDVTNTSDTADSDFFDDLDVDDLDGEFLEGDIEALIGEAALEAVQEMEEEISHEERQRRIDTADAHFKDLVKGTNEDIMRKLKSGNLSQTDKEYLETYIVEKNKALMIWVTNHYAKSFLVDNSETYDMTWSGMSNAIRTYDPEFRTKKGEPVKFATYATKCIIREVLSMQKQETKHYTNTTSMETPTSFDNKGKPQTLEDTLADSGNRPDQDLDQSMARDAIRKMLQHLDPIGRYILVMRFGIFGETRMTEKDIAIYSGMSQANVSKKETSAKKALCSKYSGARDHLLSFFG